MEALILKQNELILSQSSDTPLLIIHENEKLHINVANEVSASLIELYLGTKNKEHQREIYVGANANFEYLKLQDFDQDLLIDTKIDIQENGRLKLHNLELGKGVNINNYTTYLNSDYAQFNINALVRLYENSQSSSSIDTIHNAKHCLSSINYRHSLHDSSKALFQAKTVVNNSALHSKAFQNSNTILLSDDATIFAQPHLEILVDELEASHGATTGSLNEEQMLYLQSRGIPKEIAYAMLLKAFENEIYDNINNLKIQEFITNYKRSDYV